MGINLRYIKIWLTTAALCGSFFLSLFLPPGSYASELIYTVQTGSYSNEAIAHEQYDLILYTLNGEKLDYLRIEKIGKFYAVRLGKFKDYTDTEKFSREISDHISDIQIMKAYIKDERIKKIHRTSMPVNRQSIKEESLADLIAVEKEPVIAAKADNGEKVKKIAPAEEVKDLENDMLSRAKDKINEGNYEEALTLLSPFAADPRKYQEAVSDYIVVLIWSGKPDEALKTYEALPESFPRRVYLLRNVAKAYYDKSDFLKSRALYEQALGLAPSDREVQKGIVLSLIYAGMDEKALENIDDYLFINPDFYFLHLKRAEILLRQGKYVDALKVFRAFDSINEADSESVYNIRDDLIAGLSPEKGRELAVALKDVMNVSEAVLRDYVLVLILQRDYQTALRTFESSEMNIDKLPAHFLSWIAWAYFQTDNTEQAKVYYEQILASDPDYLKASIGLAYCYAKERKVIKASKIIEELLFENPESLEVMFAQAYVYEKSGMFWDAIQVYDRILRINRRNHTARRLMIMAFSDLGAGSHALGIADRKFPLDVLLHEKIKGDMVADRITWKEFPVAIDMLLPLLEDKKNIRARYDYIAAQTENGDMQEAVRVYEELVEEGVPVFPWIMENVALAYLYLEQPFKALELYDRMLETQPSYNSRIGRFYVLQELRDWDNAWKDLDDLDRDIPAAIRAGESVIPNWPKMELALARGWLLLYEDRMQEGEDYFNEMHQRAPADIGFRVGLSQTYLWRGWPRKALREFKITETLDSKDVKIKIGKALTLNELEFKELAREDAAALLKKHPKNKNVQLLNRQLELEEMREFLTDITFSGDDDGFGEIRARARLTQPITLYTDIYVSALWQKSSADEDELLNYFRRGGLGVEHTFNGDWRVAQEFSANYNDGENFGSLTKLTYTPDDYWTFGLSYDSFTTDMPLRAVVFDIEADRTEASATYRESEWRSYSLSLARSKFSDGNKRNQVALEYEQGLWVRNNWRERIFIGLYTSGNSKDDAQYFNPDNDLSFSVTHMTEHVVKRIYREAFVYRIYLSAGAYKQSGFSARPTGSVRYEHDIEMSDTNSLLYGVSVGVHPYDGDAVTGYSSDMSWRALF